MKPGKQTTEFKLTTVANIINALLALLVSYGLLTAEQAPLWQTAVLALAVAVIPLASALITKEYTRGRTALKLGAMQPGADRNKPEAAE